MTPDARTRSHRTAMRSFAAASLSLAFLWTLALSVSPQLHARVHGDAGQAEHSCGATLIASGSFHHSAPAPLIAVPAPAVLIVRIPALTPQWVESPFLSACLLEHAPPAAV